MTDTKHPQNCGTGYCSCIECPYEKPAEPPHTEPFGYARHDVWGDWMLCDEDDIGAIPLYEYQPLGNTPLLRKALAALEACCGWPELIEEIKEHLKP